MDLLMHPQFRNAHQRVAGCAGCWEGFPRACRCGGEIHAERGDDGVGGDYWLRRWCSACGIDWDDPVEKG